MRADARRWWSVAISVLCRPLFSTRAEIDWRQTATMPFEKKKKTKRRKSKATNNKPKRRRMSASDRALARVRARVVGLLGGGQPPYLRQDGAAGGGQWEAISLKTTTQSGGSCHSHQSAMAHAVQSGRAV